MYEAAQICKSVLNDGNFARNFMWKIFIKNQVMNFIEN